MDAQTLANGQTPYELDVLLDEGAVDHQAAVLAPQDPEEDPADVIDAQILALLVSP